MINNTLYKAINNYHRQKLGIVFATGVFDVLHQEHFNFLFKASLQAPIFILGVESDFRVKRLKGPSRPINSSKKRIQLLNQTGLINHLFVLPKEFNLPQHHTQLINKIKPKILAVSSNTPHLNEKKQIVESIGSKLKVVHLHNPTISSTTLIRSSKTSSQILHPTFTTTTTKGFGRGTKLVYPTINLNPPPCFPYIYGVYVGFVQIKDTIFPTVFHFGPRPTFNSNKPSLEAHLINKTINQLPPRVKFRFVQYLRPTIKFLNSIQLKSQINSDIDTSTQVLNQLGAKPRKLK